MYLFICTYLYVPIYMYLFICTYLYVLIYMYLFICTYLYVLIYMYLFICTYLYVSRTNIDNRVESVTVRGPKLWNKLSNKVK